MDLEDLYKKETGYDVGKIHDIGVTYFSNDYVEWLEEKLTISDTECVVCGGRLDEDTVKNGGNCCDTCWLKN